MAKRRNRFAGKKQGSGGNTAQTGSNGAALASLSQGPLPLNGSAKLIGAAGNVPQSGIIEVNNNDRLINQIWGPIGPERLMHILRESVIGNLLYQKRLFEKMCDEWPRLQKNLLSLKRDVAGLPWSIEPYTEKNADPTPTAQAKADLIERALFGMKGDIVFHERSWTGFIKDLVDAIPCAISVSEIYWEQRPGPTGGLETMPRCSRKLPPRYYGYSMQPMEEDRLMLNTTGVLSFAQVNLNDFSEFQNKFVVGIFEAHDDHPTICAMLRSLTGWFLASKYGLKWFMTYCQLFGMPFRMAEVPAGDQVTFNQVSAMLEQMGSAAWAVFPVGTKLTLSEARSQSGMMIPQRVLQEDADQQCDILILGQTLTSTSGLAGGNRALGEIHAETVRKVINAVAEFVIEVVNTQLIPAILMLNFGETSEPPNLSGSQEEPMDELALAQRDAILFDQMRLPVAKQFLYDRHSVPQPSEDDDLFEPAAPALPMQDPSQIPAGTAGFKSDAGGSSPGGATVKSIRDRLRRIRE